MTIAVDWDVKPQTKKTNDPFRGFQFVNGKRVSQAK